MATGAAAGDGILRGIFDGCLSGSDMGINRRPYHRNCSCALHKSRGHCSHVSPHSNVSYPFRRTWSEGSLAAYSGNASPPAYSSPAVPKSDMTRTRSQLSLGSEDE